MKKIGIREQRRLEKETKISKRNAEISEIIQSHHVILTTPIQESHDIPIVQYKPIQPRTPQESPRYQ